MLKETVGDASALKTDYRKRFTLLKNRILRFGYHFLNTFPVTCVKFATNDRYLLACASKDRSISVCQLGSAPPSVKFILMGHEGVVNGK